MTLAEQFNGLNWEDIKPELKRYCPIRDAWYLADKSMVKRVEASLNDLEELAFVVEVYKNR